jgi:competence protein ComEA
MNPFLHATVAEPLAGAPNTDSQNAAQRTAFSPFFPASVLVRVALGAACAFLPALALAVDVNTARLDDLQKVQGIGPKTAQRILDERDRGGPYESIEDLSDRVKGIGPKKAARLSSAGLSVGSAALVGQASQTLPAPTPTSGAVTAPEKLPATRFGGFFAR